MKKYFFSLLLFALCISCGGEKKEQVENSISADDNEIIEISESEEQAEKENKEKRLAIWKAFANECAYMRSDLLTYHIEPTKDYEDIELNKIVLTELSEREFDDLKLTSYLVQYYMGEIP